MAKYIKRKDAIRCFKATMIVDAYPETLKDELANAALGGAESINIVHCKDCKHRPIIKDKREPQYGFNLDNPRDENGWYDEECPCLCEDGYYNHYPKDEWFCANGERADDIE